VPDTYAQLNALLAGLPSGQSIQLQLLTTASDGCNLPVLTHCSDELDQIGLTDNSYAIVGPAYFTITDDPGHYIGTLTSVPLTPTPTPEPASLLLLGSGLAGLAALRSKKTVRV
jgi:hypothetical protein